MISKDIYTSIYIYVVKMYLMQMYLLETRTDAEKNRNRFWPHTHRKQHIEKKQKNLKKKKERERI